MIERKLMIPEEISRATKKITHFIIEPTVTIHKENKQDQRNGILFMKGMMSSIQEEVKSDITSIILCTKDGIIQKAHTDLHTKLCDLLNKFFNFKNAISMKIFFLSLVFFFGYFQISFCQLPQIKPYVYKPIYDSQGTAEYIELLKRRQEMDREDALRAEEKEKQRTKAKMQQTRSIYSSIYSFPSKIKDGWHSVVASNGYDFCDDRKVYVVNNQITKYVIDNWLERTISFSNQIAQGKSLIKNKKPDGTETGYIEVYFIDFCINQNSQANPPVKPGKITFWCNWKRANTVTIYIENAFKLGPFTQYFNDAPTCQQEGTLSFEFKPGTYTYKAIGTSAFDSEVTWEGTFTLTENSCVIQGLTKR